MQRASANGRFRRTGRKVVLRSRLLGVGEQVETLRGKAHDLEVALAEAWKDTERLDLLAANRWTVYGLRRDDGKVLWYVRDFNGTRLTMAHNSARQAIDAARKES